MPRILIAATLLSLLASASAHAQTSPKFFVGAAAGISTLSADARSEVTPGGADVSLYEPENGPALNLLFGLRVHDYVAVQANYIWNDNDVTLTSIRTAGSSVYEQPRTSTQHAVVGDLLLYFRDQPSALRPYLSIGAGVVRLNTNVTGQTRVFNAVPPSAHVQATRALLRVAVGIDVAVGDGWSVRYSFSEGISGNPFSAQLSPPGRRNLANFQNLFGIVRGF
jgi:outer membrane protein W